MEQYSKPKKVFLSYSHESSEHQQRVLGLAQKLRVEGLDAQIDRFVSGSPPEGWPLWMEHQIEAADFVLVVCSETYLRRYNGEEEAGKGKGATWEAVLARQELYEAQGRNEKFIPVLFEGSSRKDIPKALLGYTSYCLPGDYQKLYGYLTNQPEVVPAEIGTLRAPEENTGKNTPEAIRQRLYSRLLARLQSEHLTILAILGGNARVLKGEQGYRLVEEDVEDTALQFQQGLLGTEGKPLGEGMLYGFYVDPEKVTEALGYHKGLFNELEREGLADEREDCFRLTPLGAELLVALAVSADG